MKILLLATLGVLLGGCETQKPLTHEGIPTDSCSLVAEQRMRDAAANGYDSDLQNVIFHGVYNDCVKWKAAHSIVK